MFQMILYVFNDSLRVVLIMLTLLLNLHFLVAN